MPRMVNVTSFECVPVISHFTLSDLLQVRLRSRQVETYGWFFPNWRGHSAIMKVMSEDKKSMTVPNILCPLFFVKAVDN